MDYFDTLPSSLSCSLVALKISIFSCFPIPCQTFLQKGQRAFSNRFKMVYHFLSFKISAINILSTFYLLLLKGIFFKICQKCGELNKGIPCVHISQKSVYKQIIFAKLEIKVFDQLMLIGMLISDTADCTVQ